MGKKRNIYVYVYIYIYTRVYRVCVGKREGTRALTRCRRRWIVKKQAEETLTTLMWLRIGQVAECGEYCNEISGSVRCGDFLVS